MFTIFSRLLAAAGIVLLAGCAHTIQVSPPADTLTAKSDPEKLSPHNVAYFITGMQRETKVTTPGGGGDKVSYQPYRDLEAALYQTLSTLFPKVYSAPMPDDKDFFREKNISFVIIPTITTTSSSNSPFTWPPTHFSVTLSCTALDAEGKEIWQDTATGEGQAEFSEFKSDFGLSARRASANAFNELRKKIASSPLMQ